jgi:hypothetical protein
MFLKHSAVQLKQHVHHSQLLAAFWRLLACILAFNVEQQTVAQMRMFHFMLAAPC